MSKAHFLALPGLRPPLQGSGFEPPSQPLWRHKHLSRPLSCRKHEPLHGSLVRPEAARPAWQVQPQSRLAAGGCLGKASRPLAPIQLKPTPGLLRMGKRGKPAARVYGVQARASGNLAEDNRRPGESMLKKVVVKREVRPEGAPEKMTVCYLEATKPCRGLAFFMQGYAQTVVGYEPLLKEIAEQGVTVVAVIESWPVKLSEILDLPGVLRETQTQVVTDSKQILRMLLTEESSPLDVIEIGGAATEGDAVLGLVGHSMGGGLSFTVVDYLTNDLKREVTHLAVFSPFPGLSEAFKPATIIEGLNPDKLAKALVLTAGLDSLATKESVEKEILGPLKERLGSAHVEQKHFPLGNHFGYVGVMNLSDVDGRPVGGINLPALLRAQEVEAYDGVTGGTTERRLTGATVVYFVVEACTRASRGLASLATSIFNRDQLPETKECLRKHFERGT